MSSERIYPGQKLKLLLTKSQIEENDQALKERINLNITPQDFIESIIQEESSKIFLNFEEMIYMDPVENINFGMKISCFYCTSLGEILGELLFYQGFLNFQPDKTNIDNQLKIRSILYFIFFQILNE